MKKTVIICVVVSLIAVAIAIATVSCLNKPVEETTTENLGHLEIAPILGVSLSEGDTAGFYALTRNGTYKWLAIYEDGSEKEISHTGAFCLDDKNLCTFTREQTGGKVKLELTGEAMTFNIYQAPVDEIKDNKTKIKDDKYKINPQSVEITFPESGNYYYLVDVIYAQGQVSYGFMLTE